jgi:hypothetical protein
MKIVIKLGKGKQAKEVNIRPEWIHQLPVLAAMCAQAQEEFDAAEAVQDALELLVTCEETAHDVEIV